MWSRSKERKLDRTAAKHDGTVCDVTSGAPMAVGISKMWQNIYSIFNLFADIQCCYLKLRDSYIQDCKHA